MTRIKICGLTTVDQVAVAVEAGADAIGLVGAARLAPALDRETMARLAAEVPPFVTTVSVWRNPGLAELGEAPGDLIQLHGDEDEDFIESLGEPVLRGFAFDPDQVRRWDRCPGVCGLLVDGPDGGSGAAFDHAALAKMAGALSTPLILAGGLTPDNVADAIATVRPYAVDVSSGVESSRGVKDVGLIRRFCDAVRAADG